MQKSSFGLINAKLCRTIMKLLQKVISRSETYRNCQQVQIHVQDIHPNPLEICINPKWSTRYLFPHAGLKGTKGHEGRGGGASLWISEDFQWIWVDVLHVDLQLLNHFAHFGSGNNLLGWFPNDSAWFCFEEPKKHVFPIKMYIFT